MTPAVLTTESELREYFRNWIGPVFCVPSRNLLQRRPYMMNMVGMVLPPASADSQLWRVDWSLDKNWPELKSKNEATAEFELYIYSDLYIIKPGCDIPALAHANYHGWNFTDFKHGDTVCISQHRLIATEGSQQIYKHVHNRVGMINSKCDNPEEKTLMVCFTHRNQSTIVNITRDVLVKLPPSFASDSHQYKPVPNYSSMPKFKVGQIVRASSSIADENFLGLMGIITEVHEAKNIGFMVSSSGISYTVNFDILPTRNLSLIKGEKAPICKSIRVEEYNIDPWDEKASDKPHFSLYRCKYQRNKAWCIYEQQLAEVETKGAPRINALSGMELSVKLLNKEGKFDGISKTVSCRDLDYVWDDSVLFELAKTLIPVIAVEEDKRNPNEQCSHVYLYFFENKESVGKYVKYRILLGTLLKRKSIVKKFAKALMTQKFTHPWQVRRYLQPDSLGYFYNIYTANEWLQSIKSFEYSNA